MDYRDSMVNDFLTDENKSPSISEIFLYTNAANNKEISHDQLGIPKEE